MHVSTTKESLAAPLGLVSGAADTRGTVPMLGTVLLKAAGGKLSMLCSDTGVLARALSTCEVKGEGEIAVDVRRFHDLVRAVPEKQPLELSLEDKGSLLVKSGRSRFRLPTHPAAEYPRMEPKKDNRVSITIDSNRLLDMIEQAAPAMADADIRAYLNAMLFTLSDGRLWIVATDGHRMGVASEVIAGSESIEKTEVIVPRKTALLARKLLAQGGDVKLTLGAADFQLTFGDGTVLLGKAIDGKYPDWKKAIPAGGSVATLDPKRLRDGLAMIDAMIEDGGKKDMKGRCIEVTFDKGSLTLQRAESARCEVDAVSEVEAPVTIGVNIGYLADAVSAIGEGAEGICLSFADPQKPITVRPQGAEYPLVVVMPMRV